jgi:DNA topoisomerase-6 subunit B
MPIAAFVSIVSTKIPFKTAGKEFIADLPEMEYDIRMGLMECARGVMTHLRQKEKAQREQMRANVYEKYLPIIARDIAALAGKKKIPETTALVQTALTIKLDEEEQEEEEGAKTPSEDEGVLSEPSSEDETKLPSDEENSH